MSYSTCEAALATILKTVTGYSSTNVTQGDYKILGTGQTKAIVLQPGAFTRTIETPNQTLSHWKMSIELFLPFQTEISAIATAIRTERQSIIDKLDTYPTLNKVGGVLLGFLEAGEEPELWAIGSHRWWRQRMRVDVQEMVTATSVE